MSRQLLVLKSVRGENFMPYKRLEYSFTESGLTHVAGPNGSGKTSGIVEAVLWTLYEKTERGLSADEILRTHPTPQKMCWAEVVFDLGGKEYTIRRTRGDRKNPGRHVLVNGEVRDPSWFESITGITFHAFRHGFFFNAIKYDFPAKGPKAMAEVVESLFQTETYRKSAKIASEKAKAHQYRVDEVTAAVRRMKSEVRLDQEELRRLRGDHKRWRKQQEEARSSWRQDRVAAIRKGESDVYTYTAYLRGSQLMIHRFRTLAEHDEGLVESLREKCRAAERDLGRAQGQYEQLEEKAQATGQCPTCGQDLPDQDTQLKHVDEELRRLKGLIGKISQVRDQREASLRDLRRRIAKHQQVVGNLSRYRDRYDALVEGARSSIQRAQAELRNPPGSQPDPYEKSIARLRDKTNKNEARRIRLTKRRDRLARALAHWRAAATSLTKMRLWRLRDITEQVNEELQKALQILTDGNVVVTLRTVRQLQSKEIREEYGIDVENSRGGKSFKSLSHGEQGRVKVGFMLAFSEVLTTQSDIRLQQTILDEVLSGLDKEGVESMLDALKKFSRDRSITILSADERVRAYPVDRRLVAGKDTHGLSYIQEAK